MYPRYEKIDNLQTRYLISKFGHLPDVINICQKIINRQYRIGSFVAIVYY